MYTPNPNLAPMMRKLPQVSTEKLYDLYEWNLTRAASCREGLLRVDQAPDQRFEWLNNLLDCEAFGRAVLGEIDWREHRECETCGDEGHVESEDYPHSQVVECPTCT